MKKRLLAACLSALLLACSPMTALASNVTDADVSAGIAAEESRPDLTAEEPQVVEEQQEAEKQQTAEGQEALKEENLSEVKDVAEDAQVEEDAHPEEEEAEETKNLSEQKNDGQVSEVPEKVNAAASEEQKKEEQKCLPCMLEVLSQRQHRFLWVVHIVEIFQLQMTRIFISLHCLHREQ